MIPLELRLTNFLSYREQVTVDLRGIHLACISGPNGAGKSTLLDAMTWTLFGQSRVRSDDDLVHTQDRDGAGAEVSLLFDMEGAVYRVLRRKRVGKSAELEFQVQSGERDAPEWVSLTEARIKETQASIERVLRMNFDIFVNASFFLQGKADEFTSRTPGRRKEILAEVLGVTQWDVYGKQAAGERKRTETEVEVLRRRLEEVHAELAEAEERQARLTEALRQETTLRERLTDKELVLQQARQIQTQIDQQQQQVEARAAELSALERELDRLQHRIAERGKELAQYESILAEGARIETDFAAWVTADTGFQASQALAEQSHQLESAQNPLKLHIAAERSRLEQRRQGLDAQQKVIAADQAQVEALDAELEAARRQLALMATQLEQTATQEAELRILELEVQRLEDERKQREKDMARLTMELERVEAARIERATVEATQREASNHLTDLEAQLAALAETGECLAAWEAERTQLAAQRLQLEAEATKEKARIAQLSAEMGASCPLCGQPLTTAHRDEVVGQLEAVLVEKRQTYTQAKERERLLETQISAQSDLPARRKRLQHEMEIQQQQANRAEARLQSIDDLLSRWDDSGTADQLRTLEVWLAQQSPLATKVAELEGLRAGVARKSALERELRDGQQRITRTESRMEQIERQVAAWATEGEPELASVRHLLESETFAEEERRQMAEIQQRLDALDYDASQHQALQQQRQTLAEAPARHQALGKAQAALKPLQEALGESRQQHAERLAQRTDVQAQQDMIVASLAALRETAVDGPALENEVIRLREELSIASQTVGAAKQKVAVLDDRRRQKAESEAAQAKLARRVQQLKLLEEACGRNGVQALLIEHALPEIEERANELLDRLSGGAMRVTFDTQRMLKSRDAVAETLEIHIADSSGERPYENYSGGEQFRVNFAVRLALSHVLAHRAGASLRTLVIDEGFGSQDPEGRQRLVEAINAVQSDFACVLVITHIDELRDVFPARIEVTKGSSGSRVNVVAGL